MNRAMLTGRISGPTGAKITIRLIALLGIIAALVTFYFLLNPIHDPYENVPEVRNLVESTRTMHFVQEFLLGPVSLLFYLFLFDLWKWAFLIAIPLLSLLTVLGGGPITGVPVVLLIWCFLITDLREPQQSNG